MTHSQFLLLLGFALSIKADTTKSGPWWWEFSFQALTVVCFTLSIVTLII